MESRMGTSEDLKKSFRPAVIIAGALMASLAVYVGVALLLKASRPVPQLLLSARTVHILRLSFYAFSILQVIIIRLMRGWFFQKSSGFEALQAGRRLMLVSIITSVLSEVPALLGFILFLLSGLTRDLYPLVFVSLVLMYMFFPRLRNWEEWASGSQEQGSACIRT